MGKISNSTLNKVLLRTQGCQFAHNSSACSRCP